MPLSAMRLARGFLNQLRLHIRQVRQPDDGKRPTLLGYQVPMS